MPQRQFTKDIGKGGQVKWTAGTLVDYPAGTWDAIARSVGKPLDSFTKAVDQPDQPKVRSK